MDQPAKLLSGLIVIRNLRSLGCRLSQKQQPGGCIIADMEVGLDARAYVQWLMERHTNRALHDCMTRSSRQLTVDVNRGLIAWPPANAASSTCYLR